MATEKSVKSSEQGRMHLDVRQSNTPTQRPDPGLSSPSSTGW